MNGRAMPPLRSIRDSLMRPYPLSAGAWSELRFATLATVVVSLLVFTVQPFGLGQVPNPDRAWLIAQLSAACLVVSLAIRIGVPVLVEWRMGEGRWTLAHRVVLDLIEIVALASATLLVVVANGYATLRFARLPLFIAVTAACAVVPIMFKALLTERTLRSRFERAASEANERLERAQPRGGEAVCHSLRTQEGVLEIGLHDLRYVKAEENYVDVVYLIDGAAHHRLLRATMKDVERQLHEATVRTHRSYLVAPAAVVAVKGNAQGCRLVLADVAEEVPVSRSRTREVLARLKRRR